MKSKRIIKTGNEIKTIKTDNDINEFAKEVVTRYERKIRKNRTRYDSNTGGN